MYTRRRKKQKNQHNMCWTPLYVNKNKQRKQDRCLFFFSPWNYLSLFDLQLHAITLFFYAIEIYRIVSFWYNCVLWTVQINWKRRVNKPKKKTNNTICVGHHHTKTNTNNENKIIVCPFFFSTLTYLALFDLQLHAIPLASFTCFFLYNWNI